MIKNSLTKAIENPLNPNSIKHQKIPAIKFKITTFLKRVKLSFIKNLIGFENTNISEKIKIVE